MTRQGGFITLIAHCIRGRKPNPAILEDIEDHLLMADVGIHTTRTIIDLFAQHATKPLDSAGIMAGLRAILLHELQPVQQALIFPDASPRPHIILLVGVNGVGKTTTIGKLARYLLDQNKTVQLAAGDTFRAAAVEQLREWGKRNHVPVIARQSGADPGAVIFDCLQSARANNIDIVLADTAGRLHTQPNLMGQLKKIRSAINKFDAGIHCEVILTLDAGTGQNALVQAREFSKAIGIDSLILTKLDGTAKGGIVFSLARALAKPIRFIGVGEQIHDLRPFIADEFVEALLATDS